MRRMIGLISVVGLVAGGIAAAPGASAQVQAPSTEDASAQAGSVRWGPCTDSTLAGFHAQCGVVKVPIDYDRPNGDKIDLAVSRVRHTVPDAQFQGVMLVNPGGPGGSGLVLSVLGAFVPGGAGESYDWIGFDPRGVGSSEDALSCIPDYFGYDRPNYVATTPQLEQIWLGRSQGYAAASPPTTPRCSRTSPRRTPSGTWTASGQALGQQQINYYGFSYGTYLGQVYGTLFPERVRRMVLDSNVDPRRVWYSAPAWIRTAPSTATWASTSSGSPSTTTSSTWARPSRPSRTSTTGAGRPRRPPRRRAGSGPRVDRPLPRGRLLHLRLGGHRQRVRRLGAQRRLEAAQGALRRCCGRRQRQRVRRLPRRAVHRRPLAAELREYGGPTASGSTPRRPSRRGTTPGSTRPASTGPPHRGLRSPSTGARCRARSLLDETLDAADALRGQPRGPRPFPDFELDRRPGGDDPRRLAVGQLVRR